MPQTLIERVKAAKAEAQDIANQAAADERPMTPEEKAQFDDIVARASNLQDVINEQFAAGAQLNDLGAHDQAPEGSAGTSRPQSFGEAFVNSDAVTDLRAQYPDRIPEGAKVTTASVNVGSIKNALLTDPGLTEPLHVVDLPGLTVLDLMQVITIIDDAPTTIKTFTAAFTNAADVVAEGAAKPEATMTWTPATLNQETIAHHMPVTNQALAHNSMLRGYIDTFMVNGVRAKVQSNVATALAGWTGITAQAFDTDLRTTLRKSMTKAQVNGAQLGAGPPVIGISPNDAETLDLEQLASVVLAPGQAPQQANGIWRAPLVVSAAFADGFAYVGDMRQVVFYTSGGVNVAVGLVGNQFIENEQTIRAETEGVTGVLGAAGIVKADLTAV